MDIWYQDRDTVIAVTIPIQPDEPTGPDPADPGQDEEVDV